MKKLVVYVTLLTWLCALGTSCKKNDSGANTVSENLYVFLSSPTVEFNGFDYATITIKDQNGNDVTSTSEIYVNGNFSSNIFVPAGTGTYNVTARKGAITSDTKVLTATAPAASPFTKKLMVEDFTGTWCGYCPRGGQKIEDYSAKHPNNFIPVAVHGYAGTSDPFIYQYEKELSAAYGVTGYPTILVNRKTKWNEIDAVLDAELAKWAPLGLAIESNISGTTISGTAKVKFNVTTSQSMKIVVCLLENGLIKNQTNYYSPSGGATPYLYGGANPIVGFVHNNVLRKTATDVFGDAIPASAQTKNNIWDFNFSMSTSGNTGTGTTYTVDPAKCSIIAYVLDGTSAKKGVYNVQIAPVGSTKSFD